MKKHCLLLCAICIMATFGSFKTIRSSSHFTIQSLSPGVWAAINNDNYGHAICNAGIVDLGDKTLIFDPFMNLDAASDLKKAAFELTHRDASIIVNSHYHNDHIRGNQLFLPADVISSNWCRDKMAVSEPEELAWEKINAPKLAAMFRGKVAGKVSEKEKRELPMWLAYYDAMVTNGPLMKTTLPNITFTDSLWIHGSVRSIKLTEYKNGHTTSDVVLFLPREGIAFMGDLLFEKRHPYLADGKPQSWIETLDRIYTDPAIKTFIPGHGDVCGKPALKALSKYITDLRQLVRGSVESNVPDSAIKQLPINPIYDDWKFSQFYAPNLSFLIKESRKANN